MTSSAAAIQAFNRLAEDYDQLFTESSIGRAQRNAVWAAIDAAFKPGQTILELNCGTGEDALYMARRGLRVIACDASRAMLEVARRKQARQPRATHVQFNELPTEQIAELGYSWPFDGVLSNFAGLNCIADLRDVADQLASLTSPGSVALLCVCSRFCAWEIAYYSAQLEAGRALRRCGGRDHVRFRDLDVLVHYPSTREIKRTFSPWFTLVRTAAIGLAVPPSYLEPWSLRFPSLLKSATRIDDAVRAWPLLRNLGDHTLLTLVRNAA